MKRLVVFFIVLVLLFPSIGFTAPLRQEYQGVITSPRANASLRGVVAINGTANHPDLWKYEVRATAGLNANVPDDQWFRLRVVEDQPVFDDQLALWDTTFWPDGAYTLRLRVVRRDGNWQNFDIFPVNIENNVPTAIPPTAIPPTAIRPTATAVIIPTAPPPIPTNTPLPPPPPPTETVPPPPTETATPEQSQTATPSESQTVTQSQGQTVTQSQGETATPSETQTATPTRTQTATPTGTQTATPSETQTATPTGSQTPSADSTLTPLATIRSTLTVANQSPLLTVTPDLNQPTETITVTPTTVTIINATLVPSDTQAVALQTATTTVAEDATATAIVVDQPIILVPTASGVAGSSENNEPVATRPANNGLNLLSFGPNMNELVSASSITGACFAGAAFTTSIFLLVGLLFLLKSLLRLFY